MARGSDIAATLPAHHTVEREQKLLQAVIDRQIVPIEWVSVPVSHKFHDGSVIRGTVQVAKHALRIGTGDDNFRPTVNHVTAQKMADALKDVPESGSPDGVVLPTAKIMDAAAVASTVEVDWCLQSPDAAMRNTDRMLRHSREVDKSIGSRDGLTNTEGKGWRNTNRLRGHPELAANYGLYGRGARYRSVTGLQLWQPDPGMAHISGYNSTKFPEGYTDYSQVCERWVRALMDVDGQGQRDIRDVAKDPKYCWLISTEGPIIMRHPAVPEDGSSHPSVPPTMRPPIPILSRTLRYTHPPMSGQDVAFVQALVGAKADGIFGPRTKASVSGWQRGHADGRGRPLDVDGIVGPMTRQAMLASLSNKTVDELPDLESTFAPVPFDPHSASFNEARYYNRNVVRDTVHWIVLHAAEAAELPSTAEALGSYGHTMADGRYCSWHWSHDCDSSVASVREDFIAYHAKKANRFGVGYEHAGYTRQSRDEWLDDYSESMLWISATVAAKITLPRWNIPADNVVDAAGLREAQRLIDARKPVPDKYRGLTTHHQVTLGLGGSHVDPGAGFPMDRYLQMIKEAA